MYCDVGDLDVSGCGRNRNALLQAENVVRQYRRDELNERQLLAVN